MYNNTLYPQSGRPSSSLPFGNVITCLCEGVCNLFVFFISLFFFFFLFNYIDKLFFFSSLGSSVLSVAHRSILPHLHGGW